MNWVHIAIFSFIPFTFFHAMPCHAVLCCIVLCCVCLQRLKSSVIFDAWKCFVHPQYRPASTSAVEEEAEAETDLSREPEVSKRVTGFKIASKELIGDNANGNANDKLTGVGSLELTGGVVMASRLISDATAERHKMYLYLYPARSVPIPPISSLL